MPTIRDVAKLAGVAPITASRVINNSGYASESTRQRVEKAAEKLGYVQNRLARSLRTKKTNALALVLTDITNPFFTTVARGVEDTASKAGYTVTYCNTDENVNKQQNNLDLLIQQQVDGILLVPADNTVEPIDFIKGHDTPVVILDRHIADANVDIVRCDSEAGAYQLIRLLLELGHRQIAMLNGPKGAPTADDRLAGYKKAMTEAVLLDMNQFVQFGSFNQESGYQMAKKAMGQPTPPTAIFAANNFITIGALKALQDLDLSVPEDVALVGFDDLPPTLVTFPFLTVASQPAYEMAERATQLLLSRIDGTGPDANQEIVLPIELIIRRSSGPTVFI